MAQKRRSFLYIPLVVLVCSVLGGIYGPRIRVAAAASSDDANEVDSAAKNFLQVYALVEQNFADKVDPNKAIYKGAIPGMLRTLDPHSNFFDPHDFEALKEEQHGHYYGVGMTVQGRNGKTIVIAPFKGSPAYKAGIRPGDIINKVNGTSTDNLDTTKVADMLKGPRGTPVDIVVLREGTDEPLSFHVIRDEINRESVRDAEWIKPGIAYVEIEQFIENTGHDLQVALDHMGQNNIKGLILDLRFNPGGLLNEGIAVADQFLNKGDVVVSHHGHNSPEKIYTAQHGNHGHNYPIVVLVNHLSASAAEIVSGALQDHDRAWILGENTFGKGLVQTVFPLAENCGLALTTYRYYTPSGRLIQRDYSNLSLYDYYYNRESEDNNANKEVKLTDGGRTVYGGGGITPDVKLPPYKSNKFQDSLLQHYAIFNFAKNYANAHKIAQSFEVDDVILLDFRKFLDSEKIPYTEAELLENNDWLRSSLKSEIFVNAFGQEEGLKVRAETDPSVIKALELMPQARTLSDNARKFIATRNAATPASR